MADDLNSEPVLIADENLVVFGDGADDGRPAGVPASYAEGNSKKWSKEVIADIHAKSQLGRYQLRGFSSFNQNLPSFDELSFQPATMTRLPLEGYREQCETKTVIGDGLGLVEEPLELDIPVYIASMSFGALSANARLRWAAGRRRPVR
jgi:glutamate synthase domain-containing protein 2